MSDKPDNPSAFPIDSPIADTYEMGMNLRDYFAAKALPVVAAAHPQMNLYEHVRLSYVYADAMLKERAKE